MANGAIDLVVTTKALDEIKELTSELELAEAKILSISKKAIGTKGSFKGASDNKKLTTTIKHQATEIKKLEKEVAGWQTTNNKLGNSLKKVRRDVDNFRTSTKKAGKSTQGMSVRVKSFFKTLILFDLARRGVDAFWGAFRKGFENIKVLDSIRLQFQYIVGDMNEVANTTAFLTRISNAYGAELLTLSSRYIKFRAATKQSNMTAEDSMLIFESVTKAAGVLGLKTDELRGIFLALEQMVSKGKVTTEELRRQLGERLPGAMGIMAEAVGVTIEQLDKMLKKGEVLTKDVLVKFAQGIEKAYSIENVQRIDTLQAATVRLDNAFTEMVKNMEGGESRISKVLIGVYNWATFLTNSFGEWFMTVDQIQKVSEGLGKSKGLTEGTKILERLNKQFGGDKEVLLKKYGEKMVEIAEAVQYASGKVEEMEDQLEKVQKKSYGPKEGHMAKLTDANALQMLKDANEQLGHYKGELESLQKAYEAEKKAQDASNKSRSASVAITGAVSSAQEGYIKILKDSRKVLVALRENSNYTPQIDSLTTDIEKVDTLLSALTKKTDLNKMAMKGMEPQVAKVNKEMKQWWEIMKMLNGTLKDANELIIDTEIQELDALSSKLDALGDSLNSLADIGDNIVERAIQKLEEEMDKMNEKYDLQAELAENEIGDQEAKAERLAQIEKQREIEEKKLNKKIAKEKTKQFKIGQAAAVSDVLIQGALGIIRAKVQSLLMPPGVGDGYFALQRGLIIATSSLATAAILSQPVPKFAEGHLAGTHQGLAIINDGGIAEVVERKDGGLEMSSDQNLPIFMQKGDKVHKSLDSFLGTQNSTDNLITSIAKLNIHQKDKNDTKFKENLRKDVVNSLARLKITNNSTEVAQAVKDALEESDFKSRML